MAGEDGERVGARAAIGNSAAGHALCPAFLLRNPDDDEIAVRERRDGGSPLIKWRELVDLKFTAHLGAGGREYLRIDTLQTIRVVLAITAPRNDDIAIGQERNGRIDLKIRGGVDLHIAGHPQIAAGKKTGVDMLEAERTALPDKCRAAAVQQGYLRVFLIARALLIDPETGQRGRKSAVQLDCADAEAVAIRDVVLPDQITAGGAEAQGRVDLISRQISGRGVFTALRRVHIGRIRGLAKNGGGQGNDQTQSSQRFTGALQ